MTRVLAFGTFDLLHAGHRDFFEQARALGDELIVVVALDDTVKEVKKRLPVHHQTQRQEAVAKDPAVSQAILGHAKDKYRIIEKMRPDVIALGYDQTSFTALLAFELKKRNLTPRVVRLKAYHPDRFKSRLLRKHSTTSSHKSEAQEK